MAGENLTSFDPLLKDDYYTGVIESQMNAEWLMWNILQGRESGFAVKKPVDTGGRRIIVPVKVSRNGGVGAAGEDQLLPVAGAPGYADEIVNLAYLYGSIRLTAQVMELANGDNDYAFASALTENIKDMVEKFTKDGNRQSYGDGTGTMAVLSANASSGATSVSVNPTMTIEVGDVVDIIQTNGTLVAGSNVVSGVTYSQQGASNMIYVTGVTFSSGISANVTSGQLLVRNNGNAGKNNYNAEILGLSKAIAKTGSYLNIDPATTPVWQSTVLDNGGSPQSISETLFQAALANPRRRVGKKPSIIVTTDGVQAQFIKLLASQKRFNDTKLRGGFTSIDYNGIEVVADTDCPYGTAFVLNPDYFTFYHTRPPHWADTGGSVMHWDQTNGAKDAAIGHYSWFAQLCTNMRAAHSKITNISE